MRAVFLDRDGVINEIVYFPELGVLESRGDVRHVPGGGVRTR